MSGPPRLRRFSLVAAGDPLTPTALRRLPIGTYLYAAVAMAVMTGGRVSDEVVSFSPPADLGQAFDVVTRGRRAGRKRAPLTKERLEKVAQAYRDGPKRGKAKYVADEVGCEPDYARQLIMKAREQGLLPPSQPEEG